MNSKEEREKWDGNLQNAMGEFQSLRSSNESVRTRFGAKKEVDHDHHDPLEENKLGLWLSQNKFENFFERFKKEGFKCPTQLKSLSESDLKELGFSKMADRKDFLVAVKQIATNKTVLSEPPLPTHDLKRSSSIFFSIQQDMSTRRNEVPTARRQPGKFFLETVPEAPIDKEIVFECLCAYAKDKGLDQMILDDFSRKFEDFQNLGYSSNEALALSVRWLYTCDSWVYQQTNMLLRDDTVSLQGLAPYMNCLMKTYEQFKDDQSKYFVGTVYRRTRLSPKSISFYQPGLHFVWSSFTSTSAHFDEDSLFGDTLFVINIPTRFRWYALRMDDVSVCEHEKEVLLLPNVAFSVVSVTPGSSSKYANTETVIETQISYVCVT
eukprot:TRINITY_DN2839_c0_g2_i6.p1 TRINITY_DN2839_c0_g2~~TRINITY_DN2839_c0_g2_i6.p1  ORF type:complete len:379 (-),score=77.29 TRINITY_DN2839_c0_g2_i6:2074-3210(-)